MKITSTLDTAAQHLETLDDAAFSRLDFTWEDIRFSAQSEPMDHGGKIRLRGDMGRLYFTIENAPSRFQSIELIQSANRGIDGAYAIDRKGNVQFESVTLTDVHLKGSALIEALTLILLESESHLRALRAHLRPVAA